MRRTVRTHGGAALLYAVALAVCYAPVLFGGKTIQAPLYTTSGVVPGGPWHYSGRRAMSTFDVDMATPAFYEWPLDRYIGSVLRHGEIPLWNPYQAAGTPLVVDYSTRVFFPYQMLLDLSPFGVWDFLFLLRLWIAGWLTYCFLARAGLGWTGAALGGLSYMLSGAFTWFVNLEQLANPAMVIPLLFLAVETLVRRPDSRRATYLAGAIALLLLAGQPEVALYALAAGALYGSVRWLTAFPGSPRHFGRLIVWTLVAAMLGFGLAAPLLVPFVTHLPYTVHLHEGGGDMGVRDPTRSVFAVSMFIPTFFEVPTFQRYKPQNGLWDSLGGYGGVLAVFLLASGLIGPGWSQTPGHRPALLFFGSVWLWIVLKNFGVPPFDWIGRLPLFDRVWTPRWAGPVWCFALSAGAAFGLDRLARDDGAHPAVRARILFGAAVLLLGVGILTANGIDFLESAIITYWDFVWPGAIAAPLVAAAVIALALAAILRLRGPALAASLLGLALVERWLPIPRGYAPDSLAFRLVPVTAGLLAVALVMFRLRLLAVVCAAIALGVTIVLDWSASYGLPDRRDPAAPPPVVQFLRDRAGYDRIMGDRQVLAPNYASVFGVYDVRYVQALVVDWVDRFVFEGLETSDRRRRYALWFNGEPDHFTVDGTIVYVQPGSLEHDLRSRLRGYSLLSVRYLVAPRDMDLNRTAATPEQRFPVVYENEVVVYENRAALPRAFVVGHWDQAPSPGAARIQFLAGDFDPRAHAVVEAAPPRAGGGHGHAAILGYSPNSVTLEVEADGPALVVLTDTFYPGWHARIDGVPAAIYRVDGVVRGVFVDAGSHRITMRFFPRSQAIGLLLAGVALAACVVIVAPRPKQHVLRRSEPPRGGATAEGPDRGGSGRRSSRSRLP